ncbi:MAG: hypothetical protein KBB32_06255 [Spirochaetia bacterium]|nr:hypothetical protein [Spirochaetia bacterium]
MKRSKYVLFAVLAALTILVSFSCDFPDYGVSFTIDGIADSGGATNVLYTLHNDGYEEIENISVLIELYDATGWVDEQWTYSVNLSAGETYEGTETFFQTFDPLMEAYITAIRWDESDDDGWF